MFLWVKKMFYEFLDLVVRGGVFGFINLLLSNLFWIFGVSAVGYFFFNGDLKKIVYLFFIFPALILLTMDSTRVWGWVSYTAGFLLLMYSGRLVAMIFFNSIPSTRDKLPLIFSIVFWLTLIYYNFFGL